MPISDSGTVTRRNDGRPEIAQEQEDHHHHQRDGQQQRELHVGDRGADGLGAVGNDRLTLIGGGIEASSTRQHRLDAAHRLDDVGAGLALDRQRMIAAVAC